MRRLEDWGRLGGIGIAALALASALLFFGPRLQPAPGGRCPECP